MKRVAALLSPPFPMVHVATLMPSYDDADVEATTVTQLQHLAAVMSMRGRQRGPDCSARLRPCRCRGASVSGLLHRLHIYAMPESIPLPTSELDSRSPAPTSDDERDGRRRSVAHSAPPPVPRVVIVCLEYYCGGRVWW
jgi:hypothetical protein